MKITNQPMTYIRPVERPDKVDPSTTSIPTEAIPRGYSGDPYVTKEKAQQMLMAQQQKANVALTSAIRQSQLNEQLEPIDERLNTKGDQFIGDSKTISESGVNLPGWDAKSIEASNRDELSNILGGEHKDPSGQKDYLDALKDSNPQNDDQLMKDIDPTKQKNETVGGSKLGNKVRDGLAARGISGEYADRIDGGASPKLEHGKDNGTRVGPDVSTLSPAFDAGPQPWDFKTKQEADGGINEGPSSRPPGTVRRDSPPVREAPLYDEHGITVRKEGDERIVEGGIPLPLKDPWKGVEYRKDDQGHIIRIQRNKDGTVFVRRQPDLVPPSGQGKTPPPPAPKPEPKPAPAPTPAPDKKEKKEGKAPEKEKKLPADYKETLLGDVDNADILAFQQNGPVNPAPEPLSGRNEAQIDRLAEGVAIGIMSKINPKPYDSGGSSGPIVVGGNPIADPLEPPVPKRTNIKPRKPDGPVGPGGNSPVNPGSGGEQLSDPDDPTLSQ
jgi:hypothetical protein